jgi:hypothetical protein
MLLLTNLLDNKIKKILFYLVFSIIFFIQNFAVADCNFITARYLKEMSNPSSINSIDIVVKKNQKYKENLARIVISNSRIIPKKYRDKKFEANIYVNYQFGQCDYKAKIKAHGRAKDHAKFEDGKLFNSIQVNLKDGNILNSVKFSLVNPWSRNDLSSVLGSLFLKKLGFIVPETFQVLTRINGNERVMLFEENVEKEMLERNRRKEGPIFSGQSDILWDSKPIYKFYSLTLCKMSNKKWFFKSKNSQYISLNAFEKYQRACLRTKNKSNPIKFLKINNNEFNKFTLSLLAMNGMHGLGLTNIKAYYNVYTRQFEPIYYDGNLIVNQTIEEGTTEKKELEKAIELLRFRNFDYNQVIFNFKNDMDLLDNFKDRVLIDDSKAVSFFSTSVNNLENNLILLKNKIKGQKKFDKNFEESLYSNQIKEYISLQKKLEYKQIIISSIKNNKENYIGYSNHEEKQISLSSENLVDIISNNKLNNQHVIYIPYDHDDMNLNDIKIIKNLEGFQVDIVHSKGLKVSLEKKDRKIIFDQNKEDDWVLIKNMDLKGWSIIFKGISRDDLNIKSKNREIESDDGRFNSQGMTGCLNFFNVFFQDTLIDAENGKCEDVVNIINSIGSLKKINIQNAYADALDLDFSDLNIDQINVYNAKNDCIDVSAGIYNFNSVNVKKCLDKGVSVGEKSIVKMDEIFINDVNIGVSTKDSSITNIKKGNFKFTKYCYEVKKNKQEFNGGYLLFTNILCLSKNLIDDNSLVNMNLNEL